MFEKSVGIAGAMALCALVACGSVGGGDPSLWQPAQGFAGAQASLIQNSNGGAGGVSPTGGAGGIPFPKGGAGGGAGAYPNNGGAFPTGGFPNQGGVFNSGGAGGAAGGFGTGGIMAATGGAPSGTGGSMTNTGTCNFRFDVTTTSYGGRFHPANVAAIYVLSSSGSFVKSLAVWGTCCQNRLVNLTDWEQVSSGNTTDAITAATRQNAGSISGSWNCTDTNHQPVPDGQYQVCSSFQEDDAIPFFGPAPKKVCIPFSKGTGPISQNPPDQGNFTRMSLSMQ